MIPPVPPSLLEAVCRSCERAHIARENRDLGGGTKKKAARGECAAGREAGEGENTSGIEVQRKLPCETPFALAEVAFASPPMLTAVLVALWVVGALFD